MVQKVFKKGWIVLVTLSVSVVISAQDPAKGKVDITSAFKPVLKESAKIYFNASPAPNDTTRQKLTYTIPNQNLNFAYSPGSLKPLALEIDTGGIWDVSSYIKAGFGSLKTPFVQAGFSLGDGQTAGLDIIAKHVSSSGKILNQDYRNTSADLKGFFETDKNIRWNASLGMKQDRYYLYGHDPSVTTTPPTDSIEQNYQTWKGGIGLSNIHNTTFDISYSPQVLINVFNDGRENKESNTYIDLPLRKTIGKTFEVDLGATFDLTKYKPSKTGDVDNTFYYISPSVLFKTPNILVKAGIRPSWDNKTFKMFPNVTAEVGTEDNRFFIQAGWTGYIKRTSYQSLTQFNPYITAPSMLNNTWVEERYAGIKGSIGDHFAYSAKFGYNKYTNQPLFVNDNSAMNIYDRAYRVVYEPTMKAIHFGGELGYTVQERFSLQAGFNINQYLDLDVHDKAYGLVPLELKGAFRVQVMKDLWLKSDIFIWDGAWYKTPMGNNARLNGSQDVNAGVEFRIIKNINLWAQFNNIFNKEYERWKLYQSYGFNFLCGIIFAFDQSTR